MTTNTTPETAPAELAKFGYPINVPDQFIEAITKSQEVYAVSTAIHEAIEVGAAAVGLHEDITVRDLENYRSTRRRPRGTMTTRFIAPFAAYVRTHAADGATVFVNPDNMTATAVLDLGTLSAPGHADHQAKLQPKMTAAYNALTLITAGARSQQDVAEFLEDWASHVDCFNADGEIKPHLAIAAVRKITIEAMRKVESEEQRLSATRSAFESVQASSKDPLPTTIQFFCLPYADLKPRTFVLRLGVLTGETKPKLVLRIQKAEEHNEEIANELVECIENQVEAHMWSAGNEPQVAGGPVQQGRLIASAHHAPHRPTFSWQDPPPGRRGQQRRVPTATAGL